MVNTLMYFKKLEAAGFTRQQAEAQVEMVSDFGESQFPTKTDLAVEVAAINARFDRLEIEIARMSDKITIRLGGMMILGISAIAALIKLA